MSELALRMYQAAERLGHHWLGVEHLVLALLHPDDTSPAAIALRDCGISWDQYVAEVAQLKDDYVVRPSMPQVVGGRFSVRELTTIEARAEGLALGMTAGAPRSEHLLLAILWERTSLVAMSIIEQLGVTRGEILSKLVELNVAVPRVSLPAQVEWSDSWRMSRAEFEEVAAEWAGRGTRYRFNYVDDDEVLVSTARTAGA